MKSGDLLFANPSSQHSSGKASRKLINEARSHIYKTFNRSDKDTKLFFHSGATEAILTFTHSLVEYTRLRGKKLLVCFSHVDHPATLNLSQVYFGEHLSFYALSRDKNLRYEHDKNFEALKRLKEQDPNLVILYHHLWIHNETGQVSALAELERFKSLPDLYLHVDGVQAPGKVRDWQMLSSGDAWTFSAHKFGALKGIGFSFYKSDFPFHSLIGGGGQQDKQRSGTENVLGVKSVSLALEDLSKVDVVQNKILRDELVSFMKTQLFGLGEVFEHGQMASNTIYFYLNNLTSDIALAMFDLNGLEISAGSACSSGAAKESSVLLMLDKHSVARNGLRLSFGFHFTREELEAVKKKFASVVSRLRSN